MLDVQVNHEDCFRYVPLKRRRSLAALEWKEVITFLLGGSSFVLYAVLQLFTVQRWQPGRNHGTRVIGVLS